MSLTKDYQLIGESNRLSSNDGGCYYYTETYAKAILDEATGVYDVYIKLLLTCSRSNYTFYRYATSFNGKIGNVEVFSGTNKPWSPWTDTGSKGINATVISEGKTRVDCSDGAAHDVIISTSWKYLGKNVSYTPQNDSVAETNVTVTLPATQRVSKVSDLASDTGFIDGIISYKLTPLGSAMNNEQIVKYNGKDLSPLTRELGKFSSEQTIIIDLTDYLNLIYNDITDTTEVNLSVTLNTYNGDTVVGSDTTEAIILIPENEDTKPVINSVELSPEYLYGANFNNEFVQGKTIIKSTVNTTPKFGAEIKSTEILIDNSVYNGENLTSPGTKNVEITVTDSRGIKSDVKSMTIKVYEYRAPLIVLIPGDTEIFCYRCDENGVESDTGTNCFLRFGKQFSDIPSNKCKVNYRVREAGGQWGAENTLTDSNDFVFNGTVSNVFPEASKAYHIQLQIVDSGNEATVKTYPIAADWTDYQYNGSLKSWSFGESVQSGREKSFSLGLKAYFDKGVHPIAFVEDQIIYGAEVKDEDNVFLLPIKSLYDYTLFLIRAEGVTSLTLGIRIENKIHMLNYFSYAEISENSFLLIQGDGEAEGLDFIITHIYGLL